MVFMGKNPNKSMEVCCSPGESYRLPGGWIFRQAMEMLTAGGNESLRSINGCGSKLSTPIILDG